MSLKNLFSTMKSDGIVKQIDQYLITSYVDDPDRRSDINSPSSVLACVRASYYAKTKCPKRPPSPRTRRIWENGTAVHRRIQKYLRKMGMLLMDEVPLFHLKYQIQGHTDGILKISKIRNEIVILEIKSINTGGFSSLKGAKKKDEAQATVYMFCLEEHRLFLRERYSTEEAMRDDVAYRIVLYTSLYQHLQDDNFPGGKTREEKIDKKVKEHLLLDDILYSVTKPIRKIINLYEDKNTQEFKEYVVEWNEDLLNEALRGFIMSNIYYRLGIVPPRECRNKDSQCDYCDVCFK